MTLIAIHATARRARVMTDTWGYSFDCEMSATSKLVTLHHLDLAVLVQGSTAFQSTWTAAVMNMGRHTPTADELFDQAPAALRDVWASLLAHADEENAATGRAVTPSKSTAFLVGYSPARSSYVAHAYASEQDFTPLDLTDTAYAQPTPLTHRPGPIEAGRLRAHLAANGIAVDALDDLERRPELPAPKDRAGWIDLAKRIRVDRSECDLFSGFKTYVGGDVQLTTMTPGAIETKRVHRFASDDAALAKIFAGSLHPMSQHAPCYACDSGEPYVACCLGDMLNGSGCPCNSGQVFDDCCSVLAGAAGRIPEIAVT